MVTLGPLLPSIQHGLALSPLGIGALTALPVLALGIGSAFADRIGRRLGWGNAILLTAVLIAAGIAVRSSSDAGLAYLGALLLGTGTGFGGVFVPALLKARASRLGVAMGVYSFMLVASSTISVGSTPAIARAFAGDWRPTLGVWAIPALIAACAWLPLRRVDVPARVVTTHNVAWRSPLAWAVALNMGLQATLFYSLASWLATLLIDRGVAADTAALDLSFFYLPQIASALVAPVVLARTRHQGLVAAAAMAVAGITIVAALYGPVAWIPFWCAIVGSALGFVFAFALTFLVLRSRTAQTAATLSGMAQTVGYIMAASGPLVLGLLRAAPDPRLASTLWMSALVLGAIVSGAISGRRAFVDP